MISVTHDYTTKEFDNEEQALAYIRDEMDRQKLSYTPVVDFHDGDVRVLVFQYYTLYMEVFIIHRQFDIRRI